MTPLETKLLAALQRLHDAGESHMQAHPNDGKDWHRANATMYDELSKARVLLRPAPATQPPHEGQHDRHKGR